MDTDKLLWILDEPMHYKPRFACSHHGSNSSAYTVYVASLNLNQRKECLVNHAE